MEQQIERAVDLSVALSLQAAGGSPPAAAWSTTASVTERTLWATSSVEQALRRLEARGHVECRTTPQGMQWRLAHPMSKVTKVDFVRRPHEA